MARVPEIAAMGHPALGTETVASTTLSTDILRGLPAPVGRYLAFALTPGQPFYRQATLEWEGTFRTAPNASWRRFTARQRVTVWPPGFVWDATIRMVPLVSVQVRDAYVAGDGSTRARLAALVPLVDQHGTPEMAASALARYLGEAVWMPPALLPRAGVSWTMLDVTTARATLTDKATTVAADFAFASGGEITAVFMNRYRDVKGRGVLTPFEARVGPGYRRMSGMMVPDEGEAAWILPEGRFAFWRGRLVDARYDVMRSEISVNGGRGQ